MPTRFKEEFSAFSKVMVVSAKSLPILVGTGLAFCPALIACRSAAKHKVNHQTTDVQKGNPDM